jgi:hypothetical protein
MIFRINSFIKVSRRKTSIEPCLFWSRQRPLLLAVQDSSLAFTDTDLDIRCQGVVNQRRDLSRLSVSLAEEMTRWMQRAEPRVETKR